MSWLHCAIMSPTNTMTDKTSERWRAVGRFAQVLEAEIHARRNPFAARVVTWLNLCRICRDLEEELRKESALSVRHLPAIVGRCLLRFLLLWVWRPPTWARLSPNV